MGICTKNEATTAQLHPISLGSDSSSPFMFIALLGLAAVLLAIEGARKLWRSQSATHLSRPPLPPGPTPLPFLGNVLGMNKDAPHLTYTAWSKVYGALSLMRDAWIFVGLMIHARRSNRRHRLHLRLGPENYLVEL